MRGVLGTLLRGTLLLAAACACSYLVVVVLAATPVDQMYWMGFPTALLISAIVDSAAVLAWWHNLKTQNGRRVFGWPSSLIVGLAALSVLFG